MTAAIFYIILIIWAILMIVWGTITIKLIIELYLYLQNLLIKSTTKENLKPIKKNATKRIQKNTKKV